MKNFFTSMLGALAAMVVFSLGLFVVFFGILGIIAAIGSGDRTPSFERGSYVVVDLSANITDAPAPLELSDLMGGDRTRTLQLRSVTQALRSAAKDNRVAGVFLKGSVLPIDYGSGYAALKEVRSALEVVRAAGKPVKAYLTYATTKDLYLASTASELSIDPYGMIVMPGLASEPMFYTGAFEKYGVNIQVTRVGKYKSFVEPFTRKDMSPENREQIQKLLGDIWGNLIADVAKGRKITPAEVQKVVDAEGIIRPEAALAGKLVDRIAYRDEVIDDLKKQTRVMEPEESFKQISLGNYIKMIHDPVVVMVGKKSGSGISGGKGRIAVVYAEGDIVDGDGENNNVGGAKYATELRRLRQDDDIKAVVLRVNSPGGSASASEAIQREIRLLKAVKPVVVSMGTYAASGGYWIATYGDRIFAEPTTVTGSIGVFGIQFDVQRLANEHGITFDSVKTGRYADMLTISRPKTPDEMAVFQRLVDWSYGEFIKKVSESRQLPKEKVEEIAQGRVWSGLEAKNLGLVDEIGGLDAALKYAAEKAGLGDSFKISEYPRKKELYEALSEWFDNVNPVASRSRAGLVAQVLERVKTDLRAIESFNDPAGLYARLPLEFNLH
jgi:protease-4